MCERLIRTYRKWWRPLQDLDACRLRIESCVESIREWCSSRRLQLNSDKTELIWFGTRSMLSKLQGLETGIRVGGVEVKPVESVQDLGVTLDCQLNMRAHINEIVSACYYHLCNIRQLQHCLNKDDRQRLVSALVLSRIDHCNVALVGLPATSLAPFQRVINAAARFVANLRPSSWPCRPCSSWSTLAPNPWANIIQGVSHDVQHRQRNSADIHDWHGHAYLRSSRSVSSPFCRRGTVWRASHSNCVWFQGFLYRWPSGLEWSPFSSSSHSWRYSIQISTQNSFFFI